MAGYLLSFLYHAYSSDLDGFVVLIKTIRSNTKLGALDIDRISLGLNFSGMQRLPRRELAGEASNLVEECVLAATLR
jgi:hypothetical protein